MSARGLTLASGDTESKISTKTMNKEFIFKIKYTNGYGNNDTMFQKYKLISYKINKKVGDIPSFVASFSL